MELFLNKCKTHCCESLLNMLKLIKGLDKKKSIHTHVHAETHTLTYIHTVLLYTIIEIY